MTLFDASTLLCFSAPPPRRQRALLPPSSQRQCSGGLSFGGAKTFATISSHTARADGGIRSGLQPEAASACRMPFT